MFYVGARLPLAAKHLGKRVLSFRLTRNLAQLSRLGKEPQANYPALSIIFI